MLFDAHNHFHFQELAAMEAQLLADCAAAGVVGGVVNGTCEADWPAVAAFCERNPSWLPSFGIHPWCVDSASPGYRQTLEKFLSTTPGAAVGEIGLDLWKTTETFSLQLRIFETQVRIAAERNLPLSIHCLRAWEPLRELLHKLPLPERGFLLHAYGGPPECIPEFCSLGARFSFSATFLSPRKKKTCDAFLLVPVERILLESDAPSMLPPLSHRLWTIPSGSGEELNHPCNIQAACKGLATLLGLTEQETALRTLQNSEKLFSMQPTPVLQEDQAAGPSL